MAPRKKKVIKSEAAKAKPIPFKPISEGKKNLGAVKGLDVSAEDIERLSDLQPHEVPETLAPHVRDAVFKRMAEKRDAAPKPQSGPNVLRDPKTGRAIPKQPSGPSPVKRTKDPVVKKFKKGELVTVKPRKQKEQKPIVAKKGQIRKVNGKLIRVDESNIEDVTKAVRTTVLPDAGPDEMLPRIGPRVPLEQPKGGVKPDLISKRPGNVEQKLRGFASPVKVAAPKIWEAMGHIDALQNHQKGSKEHTHHALSFTKLVPEIVKHTHGGVADILSGVDKVAFGPDYPDKQKHLNMAKDALTETISIARAMEGRRGRASKAGNE
jgi:hypothetical protein